MMQTIVQQKMDRGHAMCGRFARIVSDRTLREKYRLERIAKLEDRYNIALTQSVAAVRASEAGRELVLLKWGLIPSWSKDAKIAYKLTNARCETVAEKPSFRSAFKQRRCLIPASGFYEWQKQGTGRKQPFFIRPCDGGVFSFAGLWERWHDPQRPIVESCSIITTEANDLMRPFHERMPVIVASSADALWLDPHASADVRRSLCVPFASERMEDFPVNPYVSNAKNEGLRCIEPPGV